jgi:catechol 2,3-dioxygenase
MTSLWPATLHHLCRATPEPERLARFYGELLGDKVERIGEGGWLVSGPGRRLVVSRGEKGAVPYFALQVKERGRLQNLRKGLEKTLALEPSPSPIFGGDAFAVADPDGRRIVLGLAGPDARDSAGRLQHFVCASTRLETVLEFYRDVLGLQESDRVLEDEALAAVFLRSDPEHHSFAAFRAPESRADHHCYETRSWNDIRDWADRMASLRIPLWWGPGRHGPGNNLFFMIEDPEGHKIEFSAELEQLPAGAPFRTWPHEQRTLNLWGSAWMRS